MSRRGGAIAALVVVLLTSGRASAATPGGTQPGDTSPEDPAAAAAALPPALAAVPMPVLELHAAITTCEDPVGEALAPHPPIVAPLTPVALLVALPCAGDAREAAYRLYVHETGEIGGIHPLLFALPTASIGWVGTDLLRDVAFGGDGVLTGTLRDPDQGRCVSRGAWRWNGFAFVLERAEVAEPCREGAPAGWRTVFPAP